MNKDYTDVITKVCELLFHAICSRESNLEDKVQSLDGEILKLLRKIGLQLMSMILSHLSSRVTRDDSEKGYKVHRRPRVKYLVLFGPIEVESPYLWNRDKKQGTRPVKNQLGITHGGRSLALEKALIDLGICQSYSQAAEQFKQHYGWSIDRSRIRRSVVKIAPQAQEYVSQRLKSSRKEYNISLDVRPGADNILVELDGCHIRTGIFQSAQTQQLTKKRQLPKKKRTIEWREVRVGLARPLENKEKRTFVALMSKYPEVVNLLVSAAIDQGMSRRSNIYAVADGGNGLYSELQSQFKNLQFILDRCHLKQHLYETAEALGLERNKKHNWVNKLVQAKLKLIDGGKVQQLLLNLRTYLGRGSANITSKGSARLSRLCNYLQRFSDCVDYNRFIELGLPIGSGEIESAHRYIPQKRLKIPGATWHPDNINSMLGLLILQANNWWEDFWQQFTERAKIPA